MERVSAALACGALVAVLAACGAGERPPVASDDGIAEASAAATLFPAPRSKPRPVCEPGSSRECLVTYVEGNRKNCFPSTQFCKANGYGWLACGERAEPPLPTPADEAEDAEEVKEPRPDEAPEVD